MLQIQAMYFDSIRCYSMLRKLPCYDKYGTIFWENVFRPPQKTMVVDRKNQKALGLLGLASGPLSDAVNASVVATEFPAEPTTKMNSSKANS